MRRSSPPSRLIDPPGDSACGQPFTAAVSERPQGDQAHVTTQVKTAHFGHLVVRDDQIEAFAVEQLDRLTSIATDSHVEPGTFQIETNNVGHDPIVVDREDFFLDACHS